MQVLHASDSRADSVLGPWLYGSVVAGMEEDRVPGIRSDMAAMNPRQPLTLHPKYDFLASNQPDDMYRKIMTFLNSMINFGSIE